MKSTTQQMDKPYYMDEAAEKAALDLGNLVSNGKLSAHHIEVLSRWWQRHFMAAGHKRLGRIIKAFTVPRSAQ